MLLLQWKTIRRCPRCGLNMPKTSRWSPPDPHLSCSQSEAVLATTCIPLKCSRHSTCSTLNTSNSSPPCAAPACHDARCLQRLLSTLTPHGDFCSICKAGPLRSSTTPSASSGPLPNEATQANRIQWHFRDLYRNGGRAARSPRPPFRYKSLKCHCILFAWVDSCGSGRRRNTLRGCKDCCLKAKARI